MLLFSPLEGSAVAQVRRFSILRSYLPHFEGPMLPRSVIPRSVIPRFVVIPRFDFPT